MDLRFLWQWIASSFKIRCIYFYRLLSGIDPKAQETESPNPERLILQFFSVQDQSVCQSGYRSVFIIRPANVRIRSAKFFEINNLNLCIFSAGKNKTWITIFYHSGIKNELFVCSCRNCHLFVFK